MKRPYSTDYRDFSEAYVLREVIAQLKVEAKAHRAERYLAARLHLAIAHLEQYLELIQNLYIESLKH